MSAILPILLASFVFRLSSIFNIYLSSFVFRLSSFVYLQHLSFVFRLSSLPIVHLSSFVFRLSSLPIVHLSSFVFRLSSKYAFLYPPPPAPDDPDSNRDFAGVLHPHPALAGWARGGNDLACAAGRGNEGRRRCLQGALARPDCPNPGVLRF